MTTVKLVSDAHALQSMRASDFDACSAYGEAVDNSLQANANVIRVEFSYESRRGGAKPIKYVAFGDDGDGMDADTLQRCLQLGFSSRFNDRGGIGRFGVGVTLAAINQCKRVEVYSKTTGGEWLLTHIDLDDIASGEQEGIPAPKPSDVPEELVKLVGTESGTLMIWRKHDKQDAPATRLMEEFVEWAGRTYRKFIWNGANIFVNGEQVPAIDPLYVTTEATRFLDDPAAHEFTPITFNWPVPRQLDFFAGDMPDESLITIRMSLLPVEFRPKKGAGGAKPALDRFIHRNAGISILRNNREVFYGPIPWWPGKPFEEIDRWWGCEISFDAALDYSFSVKNIKRGAVPLAELKKTIAGKIEPTRNSALEQVRDLWRRAAEDQKREDASRRHKKAERIAKKRDPELPAGAIDSGKDPDEEIEKFTEEYLAGKSDAEKARWRELFQSQPFTIEDDSWRGREFLDIKHLGGRDILLYNSSHLFHQVLSELEESITDSEGDSPSLELRALIDLLLISFSKAESMFPEDDEALLEQLRMYWGNFLLQYIRSWQEESA